MPHTPNERRPVNSTQFSRVTLEKKGDLTAAIFDLMLRYLDQHEVSYQNIDDACSACVGAFMEMNRLIVGKYEQGCLEKNGNWVLLEKYLNRIDEKFQGNSKA